jgi:hypothetical protein
MKGMGFGGSQYHFEALTPHYKATFAFLLNAGIPEDVIRSAQSIGVLTKGVTDQYYLTAGGAKWSEIFLTMAVQLAVEGSNSLASSMSLDMS